MRISSAPSNCSEETRVVLIGPFNGCCQSRHDKVEVSHSRSELPQISTMTHGCGILGFLPGQAPNLRGLNVKSECQNHYWVLLSPPGESSTPVLTYVFRQSVVRPQNVQVRQRSLRGQTLSWDVFARSTWAFWKRTVFLQSRSFLFLMIVINGRASRWCCHFRYRDQMWCNAVAASRWDWYVIQW